MLTATRCPWGDSHSLYIPYHDTEWGVPLHDEHRLFEMLVLEGAQAGLSWLTVLKKRNAYREAFDNFDPNIIARYDHRRTEQLLENGGIIRNRLKIDSAINNANKFLDVQRNFGSFEQYIWQFVGNRQKHNTWASLTDIPVRTTESDVMSKNLKQRGFNFVGSTICYAFMQATGMVNDHLISCFRHNEIARTCP